jgi:hypothetical protein
MLGLGYDERLGMQLPACHLLGQGHANGFQEETYVAAPSGRRSTASTD